MTALEITWQTSEAREVLRRLTIASVLENLLDPHDLDEIERAWWAINPARRNPFIDFDDFASAVEAAEVAS